MFLLLQQQRRQHLLQHLQLMLPPRPAALL